MDVKVLEKLAQDEHVKLIAKKQPTWIEPMLAYLEHNLFYDRNWYYERKLDGERCLAFIHSNQAHVRSRNNKSLNAVYPDVVQALQNLNLPNCILDGELVAFKGKETSFEKLQHRMQRNEGAIKPRIKVYYYIFDIPYVYRYDISNFPLRLRKKILKDVVPFSGIIRYSVHRLHNAKQYFKHACSAGWEGLMCKDPESPYVHVRSQSWLKFKCVANQELVVGGYTDPQGSRVGFGALLLGYYDDRGTLHYAGKVGTGFDDEFLHTLSVQLKKLEIAKCPFGEAHEIKEKHAHWVKPTLVAEIGFTEWTHDNKLRHPRFLGLRNDKDARDVRQEK
jgi:bifunctional non-homologous end joining protein LigD